MLYKKENTFKVGDLTYEILYDHPHQEKLRVFFDIENNQEDYDYIQVGSF